MSATIDTGRPVLDDGATQSPALLDDPREELAQPRILAATDGTEGADAALRLARLLAERDGALVELLTVFDPPVAVDLTPGGATYPDTTGLRLRGALWTDIQKQRRRIAPSAARWPVTFKVGQPAHEIARLAADKQHELIVVGLGAHGAMERCLGRETALRLMRSTRVPVLAVAPSASVLPRCALIATDFSRSSLRAARAALALLGETGTLYLAHVTPRSAVPFAEQAPWELPYAQSVRHLFQVLRRELRPPKGVTVTPISLLGDPAAAVLAFAATQGVDLIAAGSHGYGTIARTFLGSVSTRLVRGAECSVLVAPRS
jgi:nucleotide-binding universal stress UspA family protein